MVEESRGHRVNVTEILRCYTPLNDIFRYIYEFPGLFLLIISIWCNMYCLHIFRCTKDVEMKERHSSVFSSSLNQEAYIR